MSEKEKKMPKDVIAELTENVYKTLNFLREVRDLDEEKKWELLLSVVGVIYNGLVNVLKLIDTVMENVEGLHTRMGDLGNLLDKANDRMDATMKYMEEIHELMKKIWDLAGRKQIDKEKM